MKSNALTIVGTISNIFKKDIKGFVTGAFKSSSIPQEYRSKLYPDRIYFKGYFPNASEGFKLKLTGQIVKVQQKNGVAFWFEFEKYEIQSPEKESEAIEYLSSGLFKGIGKMNAKKIVNELGVNAFELIQEDPNCLLRVRSIPRSKIEEMIDKINQSKMVTILSNNFRQYNIPYDVLVKIYNRHKEKSLEEIIKNPYNLSLDYNCKWKDVDKLALQCNKGSHDKDRIKSIAKYMLQRQLMLQGNVYLPYEKVISAIKKELESSRPEIILENEIMSVLIDMNNTREIIIENNGETYNVNFFEMENYIAKKLYAISKQPIQKTTLDINEWIKEMERQNKFEYAKNQKEAIHELSKNNLLILTGGPGTGKTTVINGMIKTIKRINSQSKILLCSPTGRAAKRMQESTKHKASTMHRLLKFNPHTKQFTYNEANPLVADVIFIDESSMIDIDLFFNFIKAIGNKTQLILIGDIDQLPSVGPGNILKDMINSKVLTTVRLNAVYRQGEDSLIISNAHKINNRDSSLKDGKDFSFIKLTNDKQISEEILSLFLEKYNEIKDINEIQILTPYKKASVIGNQKTYNNTEYLNKIIQREVNPKSPNKKELFNGTLFREGDKVMQLKNNYEKDVFNGDTGIIKKISNQIIITFEDRDVIYEKEELKQIVLAYAITIHKSQGSEYKTVIIPVSFEHKPLLVKNLFYTAVTRGKKEVFLVGNPKALEYALDNIKDDQRYSKLDVRLRLLAA